MSWTGKIKSQNVAHKGPLKSVDQDKVCNHLFFTIIVSICICPPFERDA